VVGAGAGPGISSAIGLERKCDTVGFLPGSSANHHPTPDSNTYFNTYVYPYADASPVQLRGPL